MVNFNFWDRFLGKRPKTFKKNAVEQIKKNTLYYLQYYGRGDWIKTEQIFENTLEKTDLFKSDEGKSWFAINGIKAQIHSATHKLRVEGYPIIAGRGGKGYKYADENCEFFIEDWEDKFRAWEKRKSNLSHEEQIDLKLILKIISKLKEKGREKEAQKFEEKWNAYHPECPIPIAR